MHHPRNHPPDQPPDQPSNAPEATGHLKWYYLFQGGNVAFMQAIMGSLLALYLDRLGLEPQRIGSLIALFPFMQTTALLSAPGIEALGYRRSVFWFYGSRKLTIMALALGPWVLAWGGAGALYWFVVGCIMLFGLQRSLGETALYPWMKEFVPDPVRGRTQGLATIFGMSAGAAAVVLASALVDRGQAWGLGAIGGYQLALVVFPLIGLMGIACSTRLPGGHPPPREHRPPPGFARRLARTLRDRRFVRYLMAAGIVHGGLTIFMAFMPLYLRHVVHLSEAVVVRMTICQMVGGIIAGYLIGRLSDRLGSRIPLVALTLGMAAMPALWVALPLLGPWQKLGAQASYFFFGFGFFGALVAALRLLYNHIVPDDRKSEYMAVNYSALGLAGGLMPMLGSVSISAFDHLRGSWLGLPLTPYLPLFGFYALAWLLAAWGFSQIDAQPTPDAAAAEPAQV